MARRNKVKCARFHAQYFKRDARPYQKTVPVINEHREEGAVEGDIVPVESRGGHHHVFHETTPGSGSVEKVDIHWDDSQKSTQAVDEMYSNLLFGK